MFKQNELVLVINKGIPPLFDTYITEDFIRKDGVAPILEHEENFDMVLETRNLPLEFHSSDTVHDWDDKGEVLLLYKNGEVRLAVWDRGRWISPTTYADFLGWEESSCQEEEEEALEHAVLEIGEPIGWLPANTAAEMLLEKWNEVKASASIFIKKSNNTDWSLLLCTSNIMAFR